MWKTIYLCRRKYRKYITFSVLIEKEVLIISENGKEITKTISFKLTFIDSARHFASSILNIGNNLAEGIHQIKSKFGYDIKNVRRARFLWALLWRLKC